MAEQEKAALVAREDARMMTYAIRYPDGTILGATHRAQAERVAAEVPGRRVVLVLDVDLYEDDQAEIAALRERGPDVGEPAESTSRTYISPSLERVVMERIARYPQSHVQGDGTVHGLAAAAAILAVEEHLTRQPRDQSDANSS